MIEDGEDSLAYKILHTMMIRMRKEEKIFQIEKIE